MRTCSTGNTGWKDSGEACASHAVGSLASVRVLWHAKSIDSGRLLAETKKKVKVVEEHGCAVDTEGRCRLEKTFRSAVRQKGEHVSRMYG